MTVENVEKLQILKLEWERTCEEIRAREKQRIEEIRKKHGEEIQAKINNEEYQKALEWLRKMKVR